MSVKELYEHLGGNYEEAKMRLMSDKLITRFVTQFSKDNAFEKLQTAYENNDLKGIFEASHALKGVSANLALTPIAKISEIITSASRNGDPNELAKINLDAKMSELKNEIEKMTNAINLLK